MNCPKECQAGYVVKRETMQFHGVEQIPDDVEWMIRNGIEIGPATEARASHEIERAKRKIKQLGLYGPII